ncbi:MAG TPA: hypothetical protein VEI03_05180 [Stellaceae bacterium]|nr:hypothetical protein [Stellaceae bacterium]
MLEHGVDHLHDETLLRLGQALDALDLLQLGSWAAARRLCRGADQVLDRNGKGLGELGQQRDRHSEFEIISNAPVEGVTACVPPLTTLQKGVAVAKKWLADHPDQSEQPASLADLRGFG